MFGSLSGDARTKTKFNTRVTAIARDSKSSVMKVTMDGSKQPQEYSAVISTVPLPRLSLMDLTGVGIDKNYAQWSAIRELRYSSSIKIGMKFSRDWWNGNEAFFPIHGGQSFTDLPLRTM